MFVSGVSVLVNLSLLKLLELRLLKFGKMIVKMVTLFVQLQLCIACFNCQLNMKVIAKESQKVMRANLCRLKLLVIDEVSMLSNLNLACIHLRLEEIFDDTTNWFGASKGELSNFTAMDSRYILY